MEAQTDIQTYLERGKQALAQGQGREAAIAYAHGAQVEPNNPLVHLGLAEANLALGNYGVVQMACRRVQELQPTGGIDSLTAQALLDLLDRRYDRTLQNTDAIISQDPSIAYVHALRSHVLRILGQDYDANLARARAARLSFGGRFENCFPAIDPISSYKSASVSDSRPIDSTPLRSNQEVPSWSRSRQMVRTRFWLSQYPGLVTNLLIGINIAIYLVLALLSRDPLNINENILLEAGAQYAPLIKNGEFWRIFSAMFLHFSIFHVGLNMLSLLFIGKAVEIIYGHWRFLAIYLISGIAGGIITFFLQPNALAAGASGAIFGVFGALGVFYIVGRRALGSAGSGAITNWLFWLGLNLVWGFATPGIGVIDHIGGLVAGMIISFLLIPRIGRRRL